jgi:hypothetical protein
VLVTGHGTRDGHGPDYKPRPEHEYKPEAQAYAARKWRLCDRRRPVARAIYRCAFVLLYRMHGAAVAALVVIGVLDRSAPKRFDRDRRPVAGATRAFSRAFEKAGTR